MRLRWKGEETENKSPLEILVYRSRLLGADPGLVIVGGNTSFKDKAGRLIWVKGSGRFLREVRPSDFCPLDLDKLREARNFQKMTDGQMQAFIRHCSLDPGAPRPSIETFLHAWLPFEVVDHIHPDAMLALTNTTRPREICARIFGKELIFIPFIQSGFNLAKRLLAEFGKNPRAKGAILEKHGLVMWGNDSKTNYRQIIEIMSRAEEFIRGNRKKRNPFSNNPLKAVPRRGRLMFFKKIRPVLRKVFKRSSKKEFYFSDSNSVLEFVCSKLGSSISRKGPATPGNIFFTKRFPCFLRWRESREKPINIDTEDANRISNTIARFVRAEKAYFRRFAKSGMRMHDLYPAVILIPGMGMITAGRNIAEARLAAEIYEHTIMVMRDAQIIDEYRSFSLRNAFEIEYRPVNRRYLELIRKHSCASETMLGRK